MESEGVVPLNNKIFDPAMTNRVIDIYFFPPSAPSRAVLLLLKTLGLRYNVKTVNVLAGEQMRPEFLRMNPLHTIPVIDDSGFILYESHAILKYLVEQYAKDDSLFPRNPKEGAIVTQKICFNSSYLFPRFIEYAFPIGIMKQEPDVEKKKKVEEALDVLDGFVSGQTFCAGQNLTVADFAMIATVSTIEASGLFDFNKYPNLVAWYGRTKNALSGFGYEEINQSGANMFGEMFKMN